MEPSVLESAEFIVTHSRDVVISAPAVERAAAVLYDAMKAGHFDLAGWRKNTLNPKELNDATVNWIFVVDTLNFSFYSDSDELFTASYGGFAYTGYWSLCACINRALEEGLPITTAAYMATISDDDIRRVFRSDSAVEVALIDRRRDVLREVGQVLLDKFDGSFVNCVRQANGSAKKLLDIIVSNFPCYRDESEFEGRTVQISKRSQILIADLWACFENTGLGRFDDIDVVTMFADYRVPQTLVYMGVLQYSDELMRALQSKENIEHGDRREIEIRGASIWAVELIRRKMKETYVLSGIEAPLNAIVIDFYLWGYAKDHAQKLAHIPIHRTRTTFY
eukprot:TRINITY_DN8937_c0_g1_i1.p1 TRINITY_DN8937_c0_g1~~TRINITY_DN8937_c0_g1_i1.p1  ORF type:complete len:336 (+),score=93.01 TRINITY_DN8937_c0_g1_i1:95-1102(+)